VLFIVDFVSVEYFTYNIKFYFELCEFEILKHHKTRYPNFPSLIDVTQCNTFTLFNSLITKM